MLVAPKSNPEGQTAITAGTDVKSNRFQLFLGKHEEIMIKNRRQYAERHGYEWRVEREHVAGDRPVVWSKLVHIGRALERHRWVFWLDADALVTTLRLPLAAIADPAFDLIIARDHRGVNAGVMLVQNTTWSREFMRAAYAAVQYVGTPLEEQAAIAALLWGNRWTRHAKIVPQRTFNSYWADHRKLPSGAWQQGDLVVHLPNLHPDETRLWFSLAANYLIDDS